MLENLIGSEVSITVTDPWEFATEHGPGPLLAKILQAGPDPWGTKNEALLLRLQRPITFLNVICEYFIATARLETPGLETLMSGSAVSCNLTRIPEERALSPRPFDLSWWRGGVSLIGTLQKVPS